MKKYDVMVIGSGAGLIIAENARSHGLSIALVDKGPLGGTCLNLGCIPSKMMLYPAERVMDIREAGKLGVTAEIKDIDFLSIMDRMRKKVSDGERHIKEGLKNTTAIDFYEGEGHFVDEITLVVNDKKISADKIFVATGARPLIPQIPGIDSVEYLTNESVLGLRERPESLIIIGGGYIAAEYAHFFSAMGSEVTVVQRNKLFVPGEEPEISELLKREMGKRMKIHTHTEATAARKSGAVYTVTGHDRQTGDTFDFTGAKILIAAGRKSNADLLQVGNAGIETDVRNYIRANEYLETNRKNIWAFGDAIGRKMYRHSANREASLAWDNAIHNKMKKMDYLTVPHAIFSYPEIASVGLTEQEARDSYDTSELLAGIGRYADVAKGEAMMEKTAFAKTIVKKDTMKILGFHIIGPYASILIHEIIIAMANDLNVWALAKGMHIHPALSELIIETFRNLQEI